MVLNWYETVELKTMIRLSMGKGFSEALKHINETVGPALISKQLNTVEQKRTDKLKIEMDGSENRSKFGVSTIVGMLCCL